MARGGGTRDHRFKLAIPVYRTEVAVRVVCVCNSLPSRVVEANSVDWHILNGISIFALYFGMLFVFVLLWHISEC